AVEESPGVLRRQLGHLADVVPGEALRLGPESGTLDLDVECFGAEPVAVARLAARVAAEAGGVDAVVHLVRLRLQEAEEAADAVVVPLPVPDERLVLGRQRAVRLVDVNALPGGHADEVLLVLRPLVR